MSIRPDIARLLLAGHNNTEVARLAGCDRKTAAAARAELGLPAFPRGQQSAPSIEALFNARTEPLPDGHLGWAGSYSSRGVPVIRYRGRQASAYRIAYRMATGREPDGLVHTACEVPGCVRHVDDRVGIQRTDALYAAIFGGKQVAA